MGTGTDGKISVVLVDDHVLVREGVREILSVDADLVVVAEAADSEQAVAVIGEHRPNVVLLDVEIPGRHAADTVARIRELSPFTRIIILSMYDDATLLRRLIDEGISGYLLKNVGRHELVAAIHSVHSTTGRMVLAVSRQTMDKLNGPGEISLSEKELAVLRLVAQALSNGQIATRLDTTEASVKRHLHSAFVKLGAVSRIDAVNKAVAGSLLPDPRHGSSKPSSPKPRNR